MERYYYDCPIQSAYQNKNFGMKITAPVSHIVGKQDYEQSTQAIPAWLWGRIIENNLRATKGHKFYVMPESEALLQPQEEDEGFYVDGSRYKFINGAWKSWCNQCEAFTECFQNDYFKELSMTIDKRNNIPFFAPKVEVINA